MKKTIMIAISCLTVVLASLAFVFVNIQLESTQWEQWGRSANSFKIYVTPEEQFAPGYMVQALESSANQYHANLVKTDYVSENNQNIIVKSVYLSYESSTLSAGQLRKGRMFVPQDMNKKTCLQTANLETPIDVEQVGTFYSFFNMYRLRVQPISQMNNTTVMPVGTYVVEMLDLSQKDQFLSNLADSLHMNKEDLTKTKVVLARTTSTGFFMVIGILGILICIILLAILMSYYIVQQFKKIGVKKLLGFTSFAIWRSMIASILAAQCVTIALVIITLKIVADAPMAYLIQFLILGLIVLISTCLVCLFFLGMVRSYKISDLIKNRKPVRTVFIMNMAARFILLTFICISLFNIFPNINNVMKEYQIYQQWDSYGDQYAIADIELTQDMQTDMMNNTHVYDNKYVAFYDEYANKNGAIYTTVTQFDPLVENRYVTDPQTGNLTYPDDFDPNWVPQDFKPMIFTVNPNYLADFPLIGEDGKRISISELEEDGVYLLPDTYKSNSESMSKIFETARRSNVESSQRYAPGFETGHSTNIKIIYYKAGVDVFTFDTRVGADSNYTLKDPIFSIMTEKNGLFLEKAGCLKSSTQNSFLKFDLDKGTSEEQYTKMKTVLQQYDLEDNIVGLTKINSSFETKIEMLKTGFYVSAGIIVGLFLLAVLISVQTVATRMQMISKKITVKKIFGFSFIAKYGREMLIYSIAWFIQWLASVLIFIALQSGQIESGGEMVSPVIYLSALIIIALDGLVLFAVTVYHDKKNINCSIRRDE